MTQPTNPSGEIPVRVLIVDDHPNTAHTLARAVSQLGSKVDVIEDIDDLESARLARDIAKKIEETMQYPSQIKVTAIRETRAVDYAKQVGK